MTGGAGGAPGATPAGSSAREQRDALRRTYLALRLSLVGVVVAIFLAIAFTPSGFLPDGDGILRSISHYYYTPARIVFTAALCAAALALLALAGSGVQNALLDVAAVLAPLVAVIPTRVVPGELGPEAELGRCVVGWPTGLDCVPADQLGYVELGFWVWRVLSVTGLVVALVVALRRRGASPWRFLPLGAGAGIVVLYLVLRWSPWSTVAFEGLQMWGHLVAAASFFLLITAVAVIEAFRQGTRQGEEPAFLPRRAYAVAYAVLAAVLVVAVAWAVVVVVVRDAGDAGHAVFWAEVAGLTAFAVFWALQTLEHSRDAVAWHPVRGPRSRRAGRPA